MFRMKNGERSFYFNPSWALTRSGESVSLWSSLPPHSTSTLGVSAGSAPTSSRSPILFIGGVHGDEPEGVWLAEAFLNSLLTHYNRNSQASLQEWVLIPCLNPEGYARGERTNSAGVDLNRNFPSPDWSNEAKAPRYNPGSQPGSEPEVQGALKAIEMFRPKLIVHFHSWKPCIVYTGKPAEAIAQKLGAHSGYPCHEDIGYPTPGSLGQYGWLSKQIPVICIEEQEGTLREHVWPRFRWALMDLLR